MKAYHVSIRNDEDQGGGIVFADTAQEARKHYGRFDLDPESWLDVQAHRDKRYDGLEKLSDAELALCQWHDGWRWFFLDYPDPDEATDAEFLKWYENTFETNSTTKENKE